MTMKFFKDAKCETDEKPEEVEKLVTGDWKKYYDLKMLTADGVKFGHCTEAGDTSFAIFEEKTTTKTDEIVGAKTNKDYCKFEAIKTYTDSKCTEGAADIDKMAEVIPNIVKLHKEVNFLQKKCVNEGSNYYQGKCTEEGMEIKSFKTERCSVANDDPYQGLKDSAKFKDLYDYRDIKFDQCVKVAKDKYIAVLKKADNTPKPAKAEPGEKNDLAAPDKADPKSDANIKGKPEPEDAKPYCVIDKVAVFKDDKCGAADDSVKAEALTKLAKGWSASAKAFKKCSKIEGEESFEKVICTKDSFSATKYSDVACTKVAKDKDGKEIKTTLKWNECTKQGAKSFKFSVKEESIPEGAKYVAAGASALLAIAASLY